MLPHFALAPLGASIIPTYTYLPACLPIVRHPNTPSKPTTTSTQPQGKTNFFEKRVGEYAKSGVGVSQEDQVFSLEVDF